jgi:23S rRNA (guanosine2251-2'-O)-methyltransferase
MNEKTTLVRCPSEGCGIVFESSADRLGRSRSCPVCGVRMTARPLQVEALLAEQQRRIRGADGMPSVRLPLVAVVDNVRSLWNVGSIFRTADGCGVSRLVLTGITGCPPRREITKTALGAEQAVAWRYRADPLDAVRRLADEGFTPVALENSSRAVPVDLMEWPARVCLVVGNEVAGVSPAVLEACERHVRVPMHGVKSSLNVAVAFGVVAYHASGTLRRSAPRWANRCG